MAYMRFENVEQLIREAKIYLQNQRDCHFVCHLGTGTFGYVTEIFDYQRSRLLAAKIVKQYTKGEIKFWEKLYHPNVLPVHEIIPFIGKSCIFLMPLKACTLKEAIMQREFLHGLHKYLFTKQWIYQILCGLSYLHNSGLAHLDISTENILLSEAKNAILADFTYLTSINVLVEAYQIGSELPYRAPEVRSLEENHYCTSAWFLPEKIDLWSYGIVVLELLTDRYLNYKVENCYNGRIDMEETLCWLDDILVERNLLIIMKDSYAFSGFRVEELDSCSGFLRLFLQVDPDNRISTINALSHHFLAPFGNSVQKIHNYKKVPSCIKVKQGKTFTRNTSETSNANLSHMQRINPVERKANSINLKYSFDELANLQAGYSQEDEFSSRNLYIHSVKSNENIGQSNDDKVEKTYKKDNSTMHFTPATISDEANSIYRVTKVDEDAEDEDERTKHNGFRSSKSDESRVYGLTNVRTFFVRPRIYQILTEEENVSEILDTDSIACVKRSSRSNITVCAKAKGDFRRLNFINYVISTIRNVLKVLNFKKSHSKFKVGKKDEEKLYRFPKLK
ncbi:mitogen-activated protein kinase 6-like isoform X2 [Centruroides sculpturatus]|uniref:mitogen-activated protein kinase 6-like isoform X2 n=1 Tax=Centruroides sculpturatus TaxID=218467 RepID=UPI000C6E742E|nr:mitogen-activated protein kinase 6-like isoform X2 [Centruroides sculpturatus]